MNIISLWGCTKHFTGFRIMFIVFKLYHHGKAAEIFVLAAAVHDKPHQINDRFNHIFAGAASFGERLLDLRNNGRTAGHYDIVSGVYRVSAIHNDIHIAPVGDDDTFKSPFIP